MIDYWITNLLNIIQLGSLYLLIAVGLNIIYGICRIINLAHGSIYALGAYLLFALLNNIGIPFLLSILISPIIVALLGIILEYIAVTPTRGRRLEYSLILTYGLMTFFDGLWKYIWGSSPLYINIPKFLNFTFHMGPVEYPTYRMFIILMCMLISLGLWFLYYKTKFGMSMRATSTIPEMVNALGLNVRSIQVGAFALGCALAGFGGVIAAPLVSVYPEMGLEILITSFVVIVIGGLGSIRGTVIAAFIVSIVEVFASIYITQYSMVIIFILMALVLCIQPKGILAEGKFD